MESTFRSSLEEYGSLLKQLRDAAMQEPHPDRRDQLKEMADDVQFYVKEAANSPSLHIFTRLNIAVARAVRVYKNRTPLNSPSGGAMPIPERKAA